MIRPHEQARYKLVYLTTNDIVSIFNAASIPGEGVSLPKFSGLPRGYEVVSVYPEPMRGGWVLTLYHPSWPAVQEGHRIPEAVPRGDYELVEFKRKQAKQGP